MVAQSPLLLYSKATQDGGGLRAFTNTTGISSGCIQGGLEVSGSHHSWGHPQPMGDGSTWVNPPASFPLGTSLEGLCLGCPRSAFMALASVMCSSTGFLFPISCFHSFIPALRMPFWSITYAQALVIDITSRGTKLFNVDQL